MGLFAVRNLALAALLALPFLAWALHEVLAALNRRNVHSFPVWLLVLLGTAVPAFIALYPAERVVVHRLGVDPATAGVEAFLRTAQIQGPVFNNYDVGGLLIWTGYPRMRVFVDNRPEAYPASFFTDTYIAMQEQEVVFKQVDAEYGFRAVVFNYRDATPWAQTFLRRVVQDEQWVPVYADAAVLVLARNIPEHAVLIQRYALPRQLFTFTSR